MFPTRVIPCEKSKNNILGFKKIGQKLKKKSKKCFIIKISNTLDFFGDKSQKLENFFLGLHMESPTNKRKKKKKRKREEKKTIFSLPFQ